MKKMYLLNEKKWNPFRVSRYNAGNPGFLLIITGWGELGKVILQVSVAIFSGVKMAQSSREIGPYAYECGPMHPLGCRLNKGHGSRSGYSSTLTEH